MTPTDLIPTRAVAERLGIPFSTLHNWIDAGRITPVFQGPGKRGAKFFAPADVDRLVNELAAEAEARLATLRGAAS